MTEQETRAALEYIAEHEWLYIPFDDQYLLIEDSRIRVYYPGIDVELLRDCIDTVPDSDEEIDWTATIEEYMMVADFTPPDRAEVEKAERLAMEQNPNQLKLTL